MLQSRSERTDIATLLIPSITVADGGIYLCVGTSAAGTARASIEVVVVPGKGWECRFGDASGFGDSFGVPWVPAGPTAHLDSCRSCTTCAH